MAEERGRFNEEQIDAKVRAERDRLVKLLRDLADRIENASMDRVSGGLAWVATAVEPLVRMVDRALGQAKKR